MTLFIIIEMVFGKEYKIATRSYRVVGHAMYMLLADTYYLGSIEKPGRARHNKYLSYEDAVKAVVELESVVEEMEDLKGVE